MSMNQQVVQEQVLERSVDDVLLPLRHEQGELFLCDIADAVLKDDMASMEHPFYTLSKKPDLKIKRYENGDKWLEVIPSVKGRATIYDKDLLIYVTSQVIAALNQGKPVGRTVRIIAKDFLVFTNRDTGGRNYNLLNDMVDRIHGTKFSTNIEVDESVEEIKKWGLVDEATLIKSKKTNRILAIEIVLSPWFFSLIKRQRVLTLNPDYFRIKRPIEKRLYELARKHCGYQACWEPYLKTLWKKSGSSGSLKQFRSAIKKVVVTNHLPDYHISFNEEKDQVTFTERGSLSSWKDGDDCPYVLDGDAYDGARRVAPEWCPRTLEKEWRANWARKGREKLYDPTAAYIGFCKAWFTKRGRPR